MQRRPSAYKVRSKSVGEGMLNDAQGAVISAEEKKKMMRRKSSVPENLYVYEITVPEVEEGFDDILYYKIVIKAIGNIEWSLFRRYSDFFDVHTDISFELPTILFESEFPKKDFYSWLGPLKSSQIEKRRRKLQDWLQEFLSITNGSVRPAGAKQEEVTKMQEKLDAFLEVKEKIRTHTIAQAAKITPAVDESAIAIYGAPSTIPSIVVPKVAPSLKSVFATFGDGGDDIEGDSESNDKEDKDNDIKDNDYTNTDTNTNANVENVGDNGSAPDSINPFPNASYEENDNGHITDGGDGIEYEEDPEQQ